MSPAHRHPSLIERVLSARWPSWCLLPCLWVWAAAALAAPAAALSEFKHVAWSIDRGAPSRINSISQTHDGFLWIGSVEGLFRFDGVSFESVRLRAPGSQRLVVSSLRAMRSGDLWVGLARGRGMARWRGGELVDAQMPHPSREVNDIQEGPDGEVWVARGGRSDRMLARFHQGGWQEFGTESGLPAQQVWSLLFARDGTLWVVLSNAIARRRPADARFTVVEQGLTPRANLSEDAQGQLWISDRRGTRALNPPAGSETFFPHPSPVGGARLLFDRQGDLWMTTWNSGVLRVRVPGQPWPAAQRVTSLDATAGLTSDTARALFQDREGNLWIGTELGLDMLRPASIAIEHGVPSNSPTSYTMARANDGTVYVADAQALYAIAPGGHPVRVLGYDTPAEALCTAMGRGVWLFLADRVLQVAGASVTRHVKPAGTTAYGCAQDASGRLWMPALETGLHWQQRGRWQRWPEATPSPSLPANATVDGRGRAVVLFRGRPPQGERPFDAVDATQSPAGGVEGLLAAGPGVLLSGHRGLALAGTSGGAQLPGETHPWAASLNGLAQTSGGDTWAIGDAGVVRLRSDELARALQRPGAAVAARILDFSDGLSSFVQKAPGAQVAVGGDGRVWFLTRRHLMRVNPAGLVPNPVPPPVVVRAVQVGDQRFEAMPSLVLPAGTTTVRIAFTAPSLSVPERVKFRHRLVGLGGTWSPPDSQREALLSDLGPGSYRFEVTASNHDGVWAVQPAEVTLTIPATFTQSLGFKLMVAGLSLLLLYGLYLARLRQILSRLRERGEERARERERIAREMHDTLLQSVQGLILRFQSVADRLHGQPQVRQAMNQALDRAEAVVVEGRDRLQGLRRVDASDLEDELRRLIAEQPFSDGTRVGVSSQGTRRQLQPSAFDEILCIVSEALFNAARHANATTVDVQVDYGRQWLEITVRDDGVGLPRAGSDPAGLAGHFGLLGMRERAQRIGAQFRVTSQPGHGARVSLRIKAGVAYARDAG
ncbi:sensor histidine kinase [Roseateles sp. LKC17W]|uniref:Two-component regulator propeller domain-containing protein n=1 Tax=Pelomonas margarita TaxID=3299031 RepID=A0ABW7FL58_9BURK